MSAKTIDIRKLLAAAVLMLPLLSCFWYVAMFGTNMPYMDDWSFMSEVGHVVLKSKHHSLWQFLDHQHNEHKMGIPFLMLFFVGSATAWNWLAMMYANVVIHSLTNILLMFWAWAQMKTQRLPLLALLPIPLVMCTFRQWENLLFAFQTCIYTVNLFFLISVILLERSKALDWKFYAGFVAAFFACYCNGNGLLALPLGCLALTLQWAILPQERAVAKKKTLIWIALCVVVVVLYFSTYRHESFYKFKLAYLSENFVGCIKFLIAPFGTIYANDVANAVTWGAFFIATMLLTFFICIKRRILDRFSITAWMIILFGVAFDLLVFWGRAGFALDTSLAPSHPESFLNALCSRYSTSNAFTLAALYVLAVYTYRRGWLSSVNAACVGALICCCTYVSLTIGISLGEIWHDLRLSEKAMLENQELVSDNMLKRIFPEPSMMRKFTKQNEQIGLFHYSHEKFPSHLPVTKEPVALVTHASGVMDKQGQWHVGKESDIVVRGWTFDPRAKRPAAAVWVFVDEKPLMRAAYGLSRQDLKSFGPRMRWGHTGFETVFAAKHIGLGRHDLSLKVISSDGQRCMDTGTQVIFVVE